MAFDVATIHKDVHGSSQFRVLSCVADAATQAIDSGLDVLYHVALNQKSMTSGNPRIMPNQGAAGTAIVGTIAVTGVASGDEFFLACWGR